MLSTRNTAALVGGVWRGYSYNRSRQLTRQSQRSTAKEKAAAMINLEEIREKLGSATTVEESKKIAHYLLGYICALTDDIEKDSQGEDWGDLTFRLPPDQPRFRR
jgi:hypothetical protein